MMKEKMVEEIENFIEVVEEWMFDWFCLMVRKCVRLRVVFGG